MNTFENHKLSDRGLSKLLLINELDESLLLVGSSISLIFMFLCFHLYYTIFTCIFHTVGDGHARIWRNFTQKGGQKLVTAFSSVQGYRSAGRSIVFDWQQQSGYLVILSSLFPMFCKASFIKAAVIQKFTLFVVKQYASGDMSSILVWDLDKEQLLNTIHSTADSGISALVSSCYCHICYLSR